MSNLKLYLSSQIATLTSALFGYSVGLIGGLLVLPSFLSHFNLSSLPASELAAAQARVVSLWLVGALIGVPVGIPLCSRWGRRVCLAGTALLYVLGAGLQAASGSQQGGLRMFEMGRLVNGLGVGMGTLVGPMYISEVSTASLRGMLMSGYQTTLQLCALAGFWCAFAANAIFADDSDLQWRIPVIIQLIPGVLLLVGTFITPETPRFFAEKGRWQKATESLAWLRGLPEDDPNLVQELFEVREAAEIGQAVQARQQTSSFFREAIKRPIRRRLGVGVGLMIAQNMAGLNALNYYAPVIFMSAGFTSVSSSLFLTGLFGIVKVISAASFMFIFVHVKGNRFWLKLGSAICGISMFVLAYLVHQFMSSTPGEAPKTSLTPQGIISVLLVYIFAFAFGVSLGPISWNVCAEIFPLNLNTRCCAITTCTQWLFQIVIASITPLLLSSIGWATYLLYGICCVISYIWVEFCVPETRGVPMGRAMDILFENDRDMTRKLGDDQGGLIEEVEDVNEHTALLERVETRERERNRRGSVVAAV